MTKLVLRTRPLLVYLDSSDISNLSNPESLKDNDVLLARQKLLAWIKSGDIVVRYSLAHIMEALPISKEAAELGKLRIELIKLLCGDKVFLDPITIFLNELNGTPLESVLNDSGCWFPAMDELWSEETDKPGDPPKNRSERRRAKSLAKKNYFIASNPEAVKFVQEFPIKKSAVLDMIFGSGSQNPIGKAIQSSTKDLDFLFKWYMSNWDGSTAFTLATRKAGEEFSGILAEGSKQVKEEYEKLVQEKNELAYINEQLGTLARKIAEQAPREIVAALTEGSLPPTVEANFETLPSVTSFSNVGAQIFLASVASTKNARKPRRSDFGDLIHVIYLPYVDVFSADGATSDYIRKANVKTNAAIVTGLPALITKIQSVLSSSNS